MGVPGLFSFLRRRYPAICRATDKRKDAMSRNEGTDNLYIDMNHIIHSCTHAHVAKDRPELSRQEQFAGMAAYLEALLDLLEPRRVVLIAVDGVAPRAKMNQQRTRRFLSAYISDITDRIEKEIKREMISEAGGSLAIPDVKRFDSNIITPGTDFMVELACWLREWAADKAAHDPRFAKTAFIISDASEPGEGEHKIMKFVRHCKALPGYDPNTRHVVYGQDADLLLLTLLCHEPYFKVMREDMNSEAATAKTAREAQLAQEQQQLLQQRPLSAVAAALQQQQQQHPEAAALPPLPPVSHAAAAAVGGSHIAACSDHLHMPCFETVDIAVLRECLQWEFSELVGPPGPPGMYGSDEEDEEPEPETVTEITTKMRTDEGEGVEAAAVREPAGSDEQQQDQQDESAAGSSLAAAAAAAAALVPMASTSLSELDALPGAGDDDAGDESSDELEGLLGLAIGNSSAATTAAAPLLAAAAAAGSGAAAVRLSPSVAAGVGSSSSNTPGAPAAAAAADSFPTMSAADPSAAAAATAETAAGQLLVGADRLVSRSSSSSSTSSMGHIPAAGSPAAAATAPRPRQRGKAGLSFEALLDDLVVLSFLAGNDFLPNIPSIDIYDKPCGLDLLFAAYQQLLPQMGGHLTGGGSINRSRLVQLLVFLARDEEAAYNRRAEYRRRRAQQRRDEQAAAESQLNFLFDGGLSMGELPPGVDIEALLAGLDPSVAEALGLSSPGDKPPPPDLAGLSPGKLCEELSSRVALRVKDRLMGGDPWAQDPVGMDLPGYRQRYYESRFPELTEELGGDVDKVAARVCYDYLQGISWVLRYYTAGPAALDWQQQQQGLGSSSTGSRTHAAAAAGVAAGAAAWVAGQQQQGEAEGESEEPEQEGSGGSEAEVGEGDGVGSDDDDDDDDDDDQEGVDAGVGSSGEACGIVQIEQQQGVTEEQDAGAAAAAAAPTTAAAANSMDGSESADDDDLMALLLGGAGAAPNSKQQQQQQASVEQHSSTPRSSGAGSSSKANVMQQSHKQPAAAAAAAAAAATKACSSTANADRQQQRHGSGKAKQVTNHASAAKKKSSSKGVAAAAAAAGGIEGASWTWCYPHHYAPLMQDLAKAKLWQKQASSKQAFSAPAVTINRALRDPHCCALHEWAPPGGPVRPLLQLMCVLPAKSVADALPVTLANLIVLAESMDEEQGTSSSSRARLNKQQQRSGKAARQAARKARQAAAAEKIQGLTGLGVLAVLGEDEEQQLLGEDEESQQQQTDDSEGEDEESQPAVQSISGLTNSCQNGEKSSSRQLAGARGAVLQLNGAESGQLLSFELTGSADSDMLQLARELCSTFPNNVESLVDLTGKRWLHTGVVRLPMAQPQLAAAVLQAALALQQGSLTDRELLRNSFRPSAVVTTAAAAAAVNDRAGSGGSTSDTTSSTADCSASSTGGASSTDSIATDSAKDTGSTTKHVWPLLLKTAVGEPVTLQKAAAAAPGAGTAASAATVAATAVPGLGALGVLLGHRGGLSSIPSSTLQCLPVRQQQQRKDGQPVWEAALDVAGLPVPDHSCCLLPGAEPPPLTVTPAAWRHVSAGFSSAVSYAQKVLGIRSSSSSSSSSNADSSGEGSGRGRGGRGPGRGARGGRGGGGRDSRVDRGGRGAPAAAAVGSRGGYRGSSPTPGYAGGGFAGGTSEQQYQQPQPYLDPSYYYADEDEYHSGGSRGYRGHGGYGGNGPTSGRGRGFSSGGSSSRGRTRGRGGRY